MKKWNAIAIALVLSLAVSAAHARLMSQDEKIALVKSTLPKAAANFREGRTAEARVQLMALCTLFNGKEWQAVPPEQAALYEDLSDALWPDEVSEENLAAVVEALDKHSKAYSEKLGKLGEAMNLDTATLDGINTDPMAKILMAASKAYPEARKIALEYVKDVPHPAVQLSAQATNTEAVKLCHAVGLVASMEGWPEAYAREHLVPQALEEAQKEIDELTKLLTKPANQVEETEAGQWIPKGERISQLAGYVAWADPENARGKEVTAAGKTLTAKAKAALQAVIAAARMPKDLYKGADAAAVKARIQVLFKQDTSDPLLRVALPSNDWKRVQRWVDEGNKRRWEDLRYLTAALAIQKKDCCRVLFITYAQDFQGGKFGQLRFYGIGDSYTILKENVNK